MTKDDFLFKLLERIEKENITVIKAICMMIKESAEKTDFKINARGSSFASFEANSLDYAIKQFLKVNYGGNANTIIGNGVHEGADYAYSYFIETGNFPKRRDCFKEVIKKVKEGYKYISPEEREKTDLREITFDALRFFNLYWKVCVHKNVAIESERKLFIEAPVEMYTNKENIGKIRLTGTLDRIFKNSNGELILSDLKTSKKRITGSLKETQELSDKKSELKSLAEDNIKIKKINIKIEKVNEKAKENKISLNDAIAELSLVACSNLHVLERELQEEVSKREILFTSENSTVTIDKKIKRLEISFDENSLVIKKYNLEFNSVLMDYNEKVLSTKKAEAKLIKHEKLSKELVYVDISENNKTIDRNLKTMDELAIEIEPMQKEYNIARYASDLQAAKNQYGLQLAFYAFVYMIITKKKIHKLRVEVVVKGTNPQIQEFEWDLDVNLIKNSWEKVQIAVSTIEAVINGTDPMILFRTNSIGYIGTETNDLIDEINMIISEKGLIK